MYVIAIDPGTHQSAVVIYDTVKKRPRESVILDNKDVLTILCDYPFKRGDNVLAVEMVACYGMPVGKEVFETCVWIGRFIEGWNAEHCLVYRQEVKLHFCHSNKAKDPNIRQALIDRFGPQGTKKEPGPLYGIKSHEWSALAVGVFYADKRNYLSNGEK